MTKRVLITGVSSGIGLAQARLFLKNGFAVYGVDKAKKPDLSGNFQFLQLDITGDLPELFEAVPRVDVLCHTAGVLDAYKPLLDTTQADFEALFQVNFFAAVRITRHYLTQMLAAQSGIIINMCSIASFMAGGGGAAYTSSKHALAGFTRQLALDYAKAGIQVFGIAPGAVQTAMTATDFEPGGLAQWVADETPIGRWLRAEEIAELTMFLASGKASAMQGEIVKIDGGWSLK
ncbi:3-oxoacyl-ACP reductase [Streptococcus equi subsp. zooepidemicus]|uniref:3-ketoacyl-ACP reductase n=1 Tax=Streptococcus equi subsp. equi TaxID=148942 RepID=A0A380JRS7_9STRE|nr:3-oxoacyl-ACP reductase [Streptococcus equi]MCD3376417.1 3-oxoacyl-ACP reductase [Streptococcus equi subsp. zooepidemicus]MCD3404453.1 3-oxoacyl-ACP reductase [Streptococcus equi subsp. zooepidemicus]MCD3411205.1 3-oxoacyl-ACP reductase [Streptococcus equi subsp. zooepidemicus]MCD3444260.1 3-oxoacyl-ACP reductase [Streptococcus equi subsp. zooepidemicus]MCD3453427.1 3-oxoacyl-ACP reductase [Streptococcus equi subsp. zooepidemicus]